jgi:hypothetical protein
MSSHAAMRRSILETLAYPRRIAKANVDLSTCPHSGLFKALDTRCRQCGQNYECDWLNSTDRFNDLAGKPLEFLYRALTFGIDYVDATEELADHGEGTCECNSCEWVRHARALAREYGRRPGSAPPLQNQEYSR